MIRFGFLFVEFVELQLVTMECDEFYFFYFISLFKLSKLIILILSDNSIFLKFVMQAISVLELGGFSSIYEKLIDENAFRTYLKFTKKLSVTGKIKT